MLLGMAPVLAVEAGTTAAPPTAPTPEAPPLAELLLLLPDLTGGTTSVEPPLPWLLALEAMLVVETLTVVDRLEAFSGAKLSLAPSVTESSKTAGGSIDDATTGKDTAPVGFLRILSCNRECCDPSLSLLWPLL